MWRLAVETAERTDTQADADAEEELLRKTHWAIDKVSSDLRRFAFNTAIAAVMELLNECSRLREDNEHGYPAFRAGARPPRCCSRSHRTCQRTSTTD